MIRASGPAQTNPQTSYSVGYRTFNPTALTSRTAFISLNYQHRLSLSPLINLTYLHKALVMWILVKMTVPQPFCGVSPSSLGHYRVINLSAKLSVNKLSIHKYYHSTYICVTPFIHWPEAATKVMVDGTKPCESKLALFWFGCKILYFWRMMRIYNCKCSTHHSDRLKQ